MTAIVLDRQPLAMNLPNPNRIDLDDRAQVLLWADLLSIPADRLVEIARKVGPMSAAVRFYAAKVGDDRRSSRDESDRRVAARDR